MSLFEGSRNPGLLWAPSAALDADLGGASSKKKGGGTGNGDEGPPPPPTYNWKLVDCLIIPMIIGYLFDQAEQAYDLSDALWQAGKVDESEEWEDFADRIIATAEEGQAALDAGDCA